LRRRVGFYSIIIEGYLHGDEYAGLYKTIGRFLHSQRRKKNQLRSIDTRCLNSRPTPNTCNGPWKGRREREKESRERRIAEYKRKKKKRK